MSPTATSHQPTTAVAAVALGVVALTMLLRVWLPSVIFVYGSAGSTPAIEMGLFAAVPFALVLAFAGMVATRARATAIATSGLMGVALLTIQFANGGNPQLWAATVGTFAGLLWLTALASLSPRDAGLGIALGLTSSTMVEAALSGVSLQWHDGSLAVIAVGALAIALAVTSRAWRTHDQGVVAPVSWFAVGLVLLLFGTLAGVPSRIATIAETSGAAAAIGSSTVLGLSGALGIMLGARGASQRALSAGLIAIGGLLALVDTPATALLGHPLLAIGLSSALVIMLAPVGVSSSRARATASAGGLGAFITLGFGYYASYDMNIGIDRRAVLAAGAIALALIVLRTRQPDRDLVIEQGARDELRGLGRAVGVLAAVVVIVVGATSILGAPPDPTPRAGDGFPIRLMSFNVRMGFNLDGAYDPAAIAQVINDEAPDVVALQEVDRGWMLNGGHDVLEVLSAETGLPYAFGPAADEVWGNAILSRYPIRNIMVEPLPRVGAPMRRSALVVEVEVRPGQFIGVIATHLHHVDDEPEVRSAQAEVLADIAKFCMEERGLPTVLLGDLNADPDDDELGALMAVLRDATALLGPRDTYPSDSPDRRIDHILISPSLRASDLSVAATTVSDHLPVAVTIRG